MLVLQSLTVYPGVNTVNISLTIEWRAPLASLQMIKNLGIALNVIFIKLAYSCALTPFLFIFLSRSSLSYPHHMSIYFHFLTFASPNVYAEYRHHHNHSSPTSTLIYPHTPQRLYLCQTIILNSAFWLLFPTAVLEHIPSLPCIPFLLTLYPPSIYCFVLLPRYTENFMQGFVSFYPLFLLHPSSP